MISRLGRFEIQAEIGRGGFGQVFRAFDPVMNRVVAVKVLTATEDAGSLDRFKNEATAAGNLHHENIVTVYEFGQEGSTPFLVMEYLNGEDLQHVIRKQTPLSLYQKIRIMDQVADGLHCAHRNGVLHRDVKPANVMVLTDYAVKIMDFGIARLVRDTKTRLTQQGYLIGTVVYMAPELFAGSEMEVDALCDIWSYGVIMYELLTGKNPFQTGNMQSEMYRIVNQDPAPLPADECPAELQAVVNKLLARQREYRYQTLEDTRFDLQPILKNLEKAEADRLLSAAQQLMFQQQWSEARDAAREARKMDPQNGTARIIFEKAQTELQRQTVLPRIEERVRKSTEAAEKRNLSEAIEHLEAARKLDTTNEKVLSRLQSMRMLKARVDESTRLLGEAGKAFRDKRLTAAFEHASEAVSLDPDNREGRKLLETIQRDIQDREAERALEADMRRARGQMAVDDFDGAMETLKGSESRYPGRAAVNDLLATVADLIAQRERRRDFSRWLEKAKDLVRQEKYDEAVKELEQLLGSFPKEVEATGLLSYARQALKDKQRSEDVKRILEAAVDLNREQRYGRAIRILEEGVRQYPDELSLSRLLRLTHQDNLKFESERALQTALNQCESLRQTGHFQAALDRLSLLIAEYPNNGQLRDLESRIKQEKRNAERTTAIRNAADQAEGFLRARKPDAAVRVLESAIANPAVGAEPHLKELLERAKAAQRAEQERQHIESELKHAKGFEQVGDKATALKIIEDALLRSPASPELLEAQQRLRADLDKAERTRRIAAETTAIQDALNQKEWSLAEARLNEASRQFPDESVFADLREELARCKNDAVNQLLREGRRLLDSGEVAAAEQFLSINLLDHRDVPDVMTLGRDIVARKRELEFISERVRAARDREQRGDLSGALEALQPGFDRFPQQADLLAVQKRVKEQLAAAKQREELAAISQILDRSDWPQALKLIEKVRKEYPNEAGLNALQAKALDQRRLTLENAATAIRAKIGEGKLDAAVTLFEQNLARHPDPIVQAVKAEIAAAQALRSFEEQKRGFIAENLKQAGLNESRGDFEDALTILQKALRQYPGDPELTAAQNRAQAGLDRMKRDRALSGRVAGIKRDLDGGRLREAAKGLAEARTAFPDDPPELAAIEEQIRKERELLSGYLQAADQREQQGDFPGALEALENALRRYPHEGELLSAQQRINDQLAAARRQQVRTGIKQALDRKNWLAALQLLEDARRRYPNDVELAPLQASALDQRRVFLEQWAAAIRSRIAQNVLDDAVTLFNQNLAPYRDQSIVQAVEAEIGKARDLRAAEEQKRAFIAENLAQAQVCEQQRDFARALGIIQKAEKKHPADPELVAARNRVQASIDRAERERALTERAAAIKKLLDRGNWDDGLKRLAEARVAFPENPPELAALEQQARKLREREMQGLVEKAIGFLNLGNLTEAEKLLNKQLAPYAAEPAVVNLAKALKEEKFRQNLIETAKGHIGARRFAEAASVIDELSVGRARDPEVASLRLALQAAREAGTGPGPAPGPIPGPKPGKLLYVLAALAVVAVLVAIYLFVHKPPVENKAPEISLQEMNFGPGPPFEQSITVIGPAKVVPPTPNKSWVSVAPGSSGKGRTEFLVSVDPKGLSQGPHGAELTFAFQKTVHVTLVIPPGEKPVEKISVEPPSLIFTETSPPQTIKVTGSAQVADPIGIPSWLRLTRRDVGPKAVEFQVRALTGGLATGKEYDVELQFPQDQNVNVKLILKADQKFNSVPPSLTFDPKGGYQPQSITVTSSPGFPNPASSHPWLTYTRTNQGPDKAVFAVRIAPSALEAGKHYSAALTFSGVNRVPVDVSGPAPATPCDFRPPSLSFTYMRPGPAPAPQNFTATCPADIPEPSTAAAWIHVNRGASSAGKAEFTVTVSPERLFDMDSYSGDVAFPQKKVHIDLKIKEGRDKNVPPFGRGKWNGMLNPGDELAIRGNRVVKGSGSMIGMYKDDIQITQLTAGMKTLEEPGEANNFTLRLRNDSPDPITYIQIEWKKK